MVDNADISGRSSGAAFAESVEKDKANRAKSRSLRPLRALWPFVARYPGWLIGFLIFLVLSAAAGLILPGILKLIIDCGFGGDNPSTSEFCARASTFGEGNLLDYFWFAVIFALLYASFGALRFYFITVLGQRVIADIRRAVYDKLLTLSPAFFERIRTGEVLSRLTTDTTLIETVITGSISFALRSVATIVGAIILMFILSWKLSLMVMAIGPLIIVPAIIIGRRVRKYSRVGQDKLADASARGAEALSAVQTVQAYTREDTERARFGDAIEASFGAQRSRITVQSMLTAMIFSISMISIFGILLYGAASVSRGVITGGDIAAFTGYAILVVSSAGALTETWTNLLRAAGASERLVEILDTSSDITAPETAAPSVPATGDMRFADVSFAYPTRADSTVLHTIDLHIKAGETVAIVGPSGAGKSTLFQLLLRFYDVTTGVISLDGVDIRDLSPDHLRDQFAIVQQNTPLFSGSAMDNIRYGRAGASDADVIAAAKAAYAHDFISALPNGYDTDLGEKATTLSGGQRQRLVIARAILRNAPILLLDEATSALDAESEQAVQMAFETLSKDRTTLVIAHRLATVKKADRIIVFDDGRIVGEGTHDSLSKEGGLYARLAALQFNTQG